MSLEKNDIPKSPESVEILRIPVNKLIRSACNVRKTGGESIDELAASIFAHGLLQNLTVTEQTKHDKPTGKFEVVAGARRLAALQKLAKQNKIPKTFAVPCLPVAAATAPEMSLAENTIRQAMHPADQFTAFRSLIDQRMTVEDVAARFGVSATTVRQRLKLANVAPRLFELFRADEINLDQMMALAVTDDHAAQERVWDSAKEWQKSHHALRRALTETMVDAGDPRTRFVGLRAYLSAGGSLEKDLFQEEHEGFLTDPAKLDRLVIEKLQTVAAEVREEGWKWVEIQANAQELDLSDFDRIRPLYLPVTDEGRIDIEALQAEQEQIENAHPEAEEYPPEVEARMAEIESQIEELNERPRKYREEEIALAGAIVTVENQGQAVIYRGLIRSEDKAKWKKLSARSQTPDESDTKKQEDDMPELAAVLVEELTAHRTAALRAELLRRPDLALVAITHRLALAVCYENWSHGRPTVVSVGLEKGSGSIKHHGPTIEQSAADKRLWETLDLWQHKLPGDSGQLWDWLLSQVQGNILDLLALCTAYTINAVQMPHYADPERISAAQRLATSLDLDMAKWWQATGETYFSRVRREQIVEALAEGGVDQNLDLGKLKKAELAAEAAKRLAGTRWLPLLLR